MKIKELNADAFEYSRIISDRLNKYIQPLKEHMGVAFFSYFKMFADNTFIPLSDDFRNF